MLEVLVAGANAFVLEDASGKVRAIPDADKHGQGMCLLDDKGKVIWQAPPRAPIAPDAGNEVI